MKRISVASHDPSPRFHQWFPEKVNNKDTVNYILDNGWNKPRDIVRLLYKLQRTAAVKSDLEKAAEVKAQIDALSKELAALRKEVVLCNSIAERSGVIQEKIKTVREDEQPERKEKTDYVQFR